MKSLIPNLTVKNVSGTVEYYQKNLGFNLQMAVDISKNGVDTELERDKEYIWAMISNENVSFMIQRIDSIREDIGSFFTNIGSSLTLYIEVEDVDVFYEKIKNKVEIFKPIKNTWYGQREFYIKDLNGYILGFASKV